jgi:hypothetical protein
MGRWGDGLYHSDQALDFFGEHISAILEREIAFWTTPEEVTADTFWLVEVLCTLELMVLFEKQNIGSTAYLEAHAPAVRRWHKIVSEVWNTEWTETDSFLRVFPYHHHDYRVEQRDKIYGHLTKPTLYPNLCLSFRSRAIPTRQDARRYKPDG